ncbi:MAG: D-alanine--D-alanine ligase [Rhodobiaceae bacterium]|nr:D-alanine--D-alanine ligase [Rhodobiaceae bacterium]MCC0040861.1 D-alanine--D-alanine ligase [Rhodobiaceae bacterium]
MNPKDVHVAVLMGGWSAERPVSIDSGNGCAKALEGEGFRVTKVDVDRDIAATLKALKPDVAFNALHGPYGEDGKIQGLLEILGIPYTHSGVAASAVGMDKVKSRALFEAVGIPVAKGMVVNRLAAAKEHPMAPPYVVKPIHEGSSFGVFIVRDDQAHPPQELFAADWSFGEEVLVEEFIAGRELTCAVMGDKALDIIEIRPRTSFYDYEAKYAEGGSIHVLPAPLSPNIYRNIQKISLEAHRALGCRGVSRADFRLDDGPDGTGALVCLEVNTQPGMTATSLVPEIAAHAGIGFGALVRWMVEDASCNR